MPQHTNRNDISTLNQRLNRRARKAALAFMLAAECNNVITPDPENLVFESIKDIYPELSHKEYHAALQLAQATLDNLDSVDPHVQKVSPRWKIERMAAIDRSLLRLGAFEILNLNHEFLRKMILDYVQLGREFGEKNTHAFVNGLLDQLCQEMGLTIK